MLTVSLLSSLMGLFAHYFSSFMISKHGTYKWSRSTTSALLCREETACDRKSCTCTQYYSLTVPQPEIGFKQQRTVYIYIPVCLCSLLEQSCECTVYHDKIVFTVISRRTPKPGTSTTTTFGQLRRVKCPLFWDPTGLSLKVGRTQLTTSSCASSQWRPSSAGLPTPFLGTGSIQHL